MSSGPSPNRNPFKSQKVKLDLQLQFAVKKSETIKTTDLDKLRTETLQYWTLRALQLEKERATWVMAAPQQLQRMLTSVHGPLVRELCAHCAHDLCLAKDLQQGLPFVGILPRSPDFCKIGGEQVCDLSVAQLRAQRAERNTYVLSKVVPSEWSSDLWESTVADAQAGYMTSPVPVHDLSLRFPSHGDFQSGKKDGREPGTRSADHSTESGSNPALTHETADHFTSLLVIKMAVGVSPLMWKRDVAQAFRKVPIKHDATDLSWIVFLHADTLWASQHLAMPFGSTSANYAWHRIGSLLKVVLVNIFLALSCRSVDALFGCDPEGCKVTGGSCLTAMCNLLGFPTDPGKDDDDALGLTVLGVRVAPDISTMSVSAAVDKNKAQRWTEELSCMVKEKKCSPEKVVKFAGGLAFTCTVAAGRQGRAFVKPLYAQAHAPLRGFRMSPALFGAALWWIKFLKLEPMTR